MKQFVFDTHVTPDATVPLPPEVAANIQANQAVHVVLVLPDADEEQQWSNLAAEQFLKGYADSDAIYDDLSEG